MFQIKNKKKIMSRYYTTISKDDFLSHIKYLMLDKDGSVNHSWVYDDIELPKIITKDLSKVIFDFENCTTYEDEHGFLKNYLSGYYELSPDFHTFWVSAGGDWEIPINFILYWGDNRLRAYIPKDGNVWNKKYKTAYGSEGDSKLFDWDKYPTGIDLDQEYDYEKLTDTADNSKMMSEILNHITLHPNNSELITKQPTVPDYREKPDTLKEIYNQSPMYVDAEQFFKLYDIKERSVIKNEYDEIPNLEYQLMHAVENENYELAAQLRDKIIELKESLKNTIKTNNDNSLVDPTSCSFDINEDENDGISIFVYCDNVNDDISINHPDFETFWYSVMECVFETDHFKTLEEAKDWLISIGMTYDSSLYFGD